MTPPCGTSDIDFAWMRRRLVPEVVAFTATKLDHGMTNQSFQSLGLLCKPYWALPGTLANIGHSLAACMLESMLNCDLRLQLCFLQTSLRQYLKLAIEMFDRRGPSRWSRCSHYDFNMVTNPDLCDVLEKDLR